MKSVRHLTSAVLVEAPFDAMRVQTRRSYNNSGSNEDDDQGEFTEVRRKGRSGRGGRTTTTRIKGQEVHALKMLTEVAPSSQSLADYIPEQTTEQETAE